MTLLIRIYLSKPGRGSQLVGALQRTATTLIRSGQADSVLLCQDRDKSERILWIENRRPAAGAFTLDEFLDVLAPAPTTWSLEFLDGFYRFPMPACEVWCLELRTSTSDQAQTLSGLLGVTRRAARDGNVAGLSVYRAVGDPTLLVAFVAVRSGIVPELYFGTQFDAQPKARAPAWRPLTVNWTMGRLSSGAGHLLSPAHYPSTAFWARSGSRHGPGAGT